MSDKTILAVICGGPSAEHDISLMSAKNVINSVDQERFELQIIYLTKRGQWHLLKNWPELAPFERINPLFGDTRGKWWSLDTNQIYQTDVVFPITHGKLVEDGALQGLLDLLQLPYVGSKVLGSAIAMDKIVSKQALQEAGIPVAQYRYRHREQIDQLDLDLLIEELSLPIFVKPANTGSSLGVSKAQNKEQLQQAIEEALKYDDRIIFEQAIIGREIECAVLGNFNFSVSKPGEIIPQGKHEFYDYDAKYFDDAGAQLKVPTELTAEQQQSMEQLAIKAAQTLNVKGLSRVDFLLDHQGQFYLNELNTLPGFTNISMYPKLWEVSGITQQELVTKLVELATK